MSRTREALQLGSRLTQASSTYSAHCKGDYIISAVYMISCGRRRYAQSRPGESSYSNQGLILNSGRKFLHFPSSQWQKTASSWTGPCLISVVRASLTTLRNLRLRRSSVALEMYSVHYFYKNEIQCTYKEFQSPQGHLLPRWIESIVRVKSLTTKT